MLAVEAVDMDKLDRELERDQATFEAQVQAYRQLGVEARKRFPTSGDN